MSNDAFPGTRACVRVLLAAVAAAVLGACSAPGLRAPGAEPQQAKIVPLRAERPLVALALGSGGSRGFAHIGVIKALEAAGIRPDIVVGSSAGAVVAALYASGLDAGRLEALALEIEEGDLIDFSLFDGMRVRGERLAAFVRHNVRGRPIERFDRAFAVVATDARTGAMAVFNRGDAGMAVQASSSVPRLFVPPVIAGREYVDGGLSSPVPVRVARSMGADVVIAVDVSRLDQRRARSRRASDDGRPPSWSRSARHALLEAELAGADVVIRPAVERTRIIDFDQKAANIAAGEAAAVAAITGVGAALERARSRARAGARGVPRAGAGGAS